jgi:Ca2+-binding RTX toxin-like protein
MTPAARIKPRPLVVSAIVAATLGLGADQAAAAYTAKVENGTLSLRGNGASDTLALHVRVGEPDVLEADVGFDGTIDFSFDRSTFTAVDVLAAGGDDTVRILSQSNGFPDEVTTIDGGSGADTLIGNVGDQTLIGGSGDDAVTGGDGDDTARLGSGTDRFTWNPGDDNDVVDGEGGDDVLDFNGSNAGETYDISPDGARVRLLRDVASIVMDLDIETIDLDTFGGTDTIAAGNVAGTGLEDYDIDLNGNNGLGDQQADSVIVGATPESDDLTVTTPGAGVAVSGLAATVRVTGGEAHDEVNVGTGEGDDTVTSSIETAGAALVDVDGGAGEDSVAYLGSAAGDQFGATSNGAKLRVGGIASLPLDAIVEHVRLLALGGDDMLFAVGNVAALGRLTFDGGSGADDLRGGNGADHLLGGSGDDLVDGNQGIDVAELGSGTDRFSWDPGDGNDTVEGQGGDDTVAFNGSSIGELIELSADGDRARLTRNVANISMDADGVETFAIRSVGGTDTVTTNDLSGTDVDATDVDLGGDGVADTVIANGSGGADAARISRTGAQARVRGLGAETRVTGSEPTDLLHVRTLGGDDEVTIASNLHDLIGLAVDLGADD